MYNQKPRATFFWLIGKIEQRMQRRQYPSNMIMQLVMFEFFRNRMYATTLRHRTVRLTDSMLLIENYINVKPKTNSYIFCLIRTTRAADNTTAESIKDDDEICDV